MIILTVLTWITYVFAVGFGLLCLGKNKFNKTNKHFHSSSFIVIFFLSFFYLQSYFNCTAQGLYFATDFIEEHGQYVKKVLRWTILSILALHAGLFIFEGEIPKLNIILGVLAHLSYYSLLPQFPFIKPSSPEAIVACVMVVLSHFVWFHSMLDQSYYTFKEITAIFIVCVWLIPISLIISLSTTEPLPFDNNGGNGENKKRRNIVANILRLIKRKQDEIIPSCY